jgi:hypothetical protein
MGFGPKDRLLTLSEQLSRLKSQFPDGIGQVERRSKKERRADGNKFRLIWRQTVKSSPLGGRYLIEVRWLGVGKAHVLVVSPRISHPEGKRIPHTYPDIDGLVCMCLHLSEEWSGRQSIASTVIYWAIEWLYYYELWVATGEWHGGGHTFEVPAKPLTGASPAATVNP